MRNRGLGVRAPAASAPQPVLARLLVALALLVGLGSSAGSALGQSTLPAVGTQTTLDIATWNIEWFGSVSNGPSDDPRQFRSVLAILRQASIDLWAVQEIADEEAFAALLDSLGAPYEGVLATESGQQRVGFIYNSDVIQPRGRPRHILTDFDYAFAGRPPLELEATVQLPDTTVRVTFVTVHMKCCSRQRSDYERRQEAAQRLKNRIDILQPSEAIVVLGDFNDELGASTYLSQPSPYQRFLDDPDDYRFLSKPLDDADVGTYCASASCTGSTLDHILITNELFDAYIAGTADRYEAVITEVPAFAASTSDHVPVVARFAFSGTGTARESPVALTAPVLGSIYPQPMHGHGRLPLALSRPALVSVTLVDALGRQVAAPAQRFLAAGAHTLPLDLTTKPAGLYLLRVLIDGQSFYRSVLLLP